MPIPLGILAAAGFRPAGAAGAYEHIETITVGSTPVSSVTFSNLNTYSTTYQHLQIRSNAGLTTGGAVWQFLTFNGDTAANYSDHGLLGTGSGVASGAGTSRNSIRYSFIDSTRPVASILDILDAYETNKFKTTRTFAGVHGFITEVHLRSGNWRSTNAISSITLTAEANNFTQGSRFSLYGLKASA